MKIVMVRATRAIQIEELKANAPAGAATQVLDNSQEGSGIGSPASTFPLSSGSELSRPITGAPMLRVPEEACSTSAVLMVARAALASS